MKSKLLILLVFFVGILFSTPSKAMDIPLLTWEQGKSQSVVLGGPTAANDWRVSLIAASGVGSPFRASALNDSGFRVYTIDLSTSQAAGKYTIETQSPGSPRTVVSEVLIVPAETYEVPKAPFDLLFILGFLALFVSAVVSIRKTKTIVASFPNRISNVDNLVIDQASKSIKRFKENSIENRRVKFVTGLPESFLKTVLLADSNFAFTLPFRSFVLLPALSLVLGGALFLTQESGSPFSNLSVVILALLILACHFDSVSGIVGALAFLSFYVALSGSLDIRSGLAALVLCGVFVFPAIFSLIGKLTSFQLTNSERATHSVLSIFGILFIPCAYLVIKSLSPESAISSGGIPFLMAASVASIAIKDRLMGQFLANEFQKSEKEIPATDIPRLFSNGSIVAWFVVLAVLFMNWTENLTISLLAAFAWTAPFLLSSIRLNAEALRFFARVPRLVWLEIAIVLGSLIGVFLAARNLPYLVQDLSELLLILLAIPSVAHALFVLLASSHQDQVIRA